MWARSRKPSRTRCGTARSLKRRRSSASGATPTPPPTRTAPAATGETSRGEAKELPSGPVIQTPSPSPRSQSRSVPGPTASSRKSSRTPPPAAGSVVGDRDRPRQEGAAVARVPALGRGEHVELPRLGLRPLAIDQRDDPVAARVAVRRRPRRACGRRARSWLRAAASCAAAWISCSERTSSSIPPPEAIARTAAVAAVIVVIEGIPCLIAAVRIS